MHQSGPGLASRRSSAATSGSRYAGESDRTRSSQPTATESKNLRTEPLKSRLLQENRATAEELTARPSARTSGPDDRDRAPPSSVPPVHAQRADHRGLQGHGLEPHLGEAGLGQSRLHLPTPGRRGLVAGPRAPGLMGHGYQATAP
jgi:hypothetical protein